MTCAYIDIVILIYYCDYHSYLCLFIIAIFVGIYIYITYAYQKSIRPLDERNPGEESTPTNVPLWEIPI